MLNIDMTDVWGVLDACKPYLIGLIVILVAAVIVIIAVKKQSAPKKYLIRGSSIIALGLALVTVLNLICFGPMNTLISLAMGDGTITENTSAQAEELGEDIAEEGIVLLENDNSVLPLQGGSPINVFGWASTNPVYGGTGSGSLNAAYHTTSLLEGIENAGFQVNKELSEFYTEYRDARPLLSSNEQDYTLPEPPINMYTDELVENAKKFSDTALIVISRAGGEHYDLPTDMAAVIDGSWADESLYRTSSFENNSEEYDEFEKGQHYLELSKSEKDMIEMVCDNFEDVVVIYNGANTMELGFVEEYEQIQGVLWCPGTGQTGFKALGNILNGTINPSAKTADTFVYDLQKAPSWNNFGKFDYTNMDEYQTISNDHEETPSFVNYVEGIYVGYKFYETAAQEGLIDYEATVQYPFGYGMSYTEFEKHIENVTEDESGNINIEINVTNTGDIAGKDVIELYYNPPYKNRGIEKAVSNLIAFEKTELLKPGESKEYTVTFSKEDMAAYDTYENGCYVLEKGEYIISINEDSHNIVDSYRYNVSETVVYDGENPRSTDESVATNKFTFAEGDGEVTYLSRADHFANYEEAIAAPSSLEMSELHKKTFVNKDTYNPEKYNISDDKMPVTGADNNIKAVDLRGAAYEDPKWDKLLDELTVEEMNTLIALGGYQTAEVDSIGKLQTIDCDGPASINNNFTRVGSVGFPSAVMIANTWNKALAESFGDSIGKMADEMNVSGWYAPAVNIHRSAFAGRNFEYFSEDGILTGKMAAQAIVGAQKYGVYAYVKHFALNDQEQNRQAMLCTWSNEQAIREIYLKPFEICIKEGDSKAVMSSYNFIGTTWAGACAPLLKDVLRGEWGFQGMVITDSFGRGGRGVMDADWAIRNGSDCMLINYDGGNNYVSDTESATSVLAMREAVKNILYTTVNSRTYAEENLQSGMETWQKIFIGVDVILVAGLLALEVLVVTRYRKKCNDTSVVAKNDQK